MKKQIEKIKIKWVTNVRAEVDLFTLFAYLFLFGLAISFIIMSIGSIINMKNTDSKDCKDLGNLTKEELPVSCYSYYNLEERK